MPTGDIRPIRAMTSRPRWSGSTSAERRQSLWIVGRHGEPLDERRHVSSCAVVQLVPIGTHRHRAEGLEGPSVVAPGGEVLRDAREAPDRRCGGPGPRERLEIERRPRGLVCGKPSPLQRCAKEPHRILRAAELVREIARPREPQRAEPRIGGQCGGPLQRRERDVETPTEPGPIRRGIERRGDLLVRLPCGRSPVPDSPVWITRERPCERGVRQPALLAGCRLMDGRPDQRMPEPERAVVDRSEAGRHGRRPGVDVHGRSEQRFGRPAQLGEVAVLQRREQEQRSHIGVEGGEPRRERRLEPSRQRQRLRCSGQVEIDRGGRELDQGERIAGRLREDPPLQLVGQGGSVQLEERARRAVVQAGEDEVREPGLVEIARHAGADREEQDHRLHLQPSREERQHLGRRPVEPMRIVDDEQQRCPRRALGEHAEGRQTDQEGIGRIALGVAKSDVERPALRIRKVVQAIEERKQQPVEPPEGEPRLGLRRRRRHDRGASLVRPAPSRLEQSRLADSRLTTDHQGAPAPLDLIDHPVEALQLRIAPEEPPPRRAHLPHGGDCP